jgi:hypothetical protein
MTHVPSAEETFAYLARTVVECRHKMGGFATRWEIESNGIRVRIEAADGTVNTKVTTWEQLVDFPPTLAIHAGMAAAELFEMIKHREQKRTAAGEAPIGGAQQ